MSAIEIIRQGVMIILGFIGAMILIGFFFSLVDKGQVGEAALLLTAVIGAAVVWLLWKILEQLKLMNKHTSD